MKYAVVLVPFPFDDFSASKLRPAVCLTEMIGDYKHLVCAFITSNIGEYLEASDIILKKSEPNFILTGLKVSSAIRLHRLITIPQKMILRSLGELPPSTIAVVQKKLKELFGL